MSRYLGASDVQAIQNLLSAERLATFQALTASGSPEDAIELHQTTMSLGVSIMAVTGLIEVSLRNAVCHVMHNNFGGNHWLRTPPPNTFTWAYLEESSIAKATTQAQRAAYSKMTGAQKSALDAQAYPNGVPSNAKHRMIAKKRQSTITIPDSQVIAQLTIHFWKRMFSENYEQTLWKPALKTVFPNKTLGRSDVADHLEVIYEMRNRLAHHEPVYGTRLEKILESIDFVTLNLYSRRPALENPFAKLIMPQRDLLHGQVAIFEATFRRLTP
ncbi:Abi-like protein [Nereida ignava]|uniref:Abi-like protein n=1 Tax=Nereida ignava TaxID=282199 RepID=A0A0U1NNH1_9RHOB|nr:Abi family protein [Nereida ignava]CRK76285.1 Abi-like protein [Nereida ignava]SFJ81766.1 Abi-like protein [Nereida ignava DSM 16309]